MTTKIPVELSSTPGIVDGSNATAITIDSSENVGIGTTSPLVKTHIHNGSDAKNIVLITGADTTTEYLGLGTESGIGYITSGSSSSDSHSLAFRYAASGVETEAMRIDSSGKVGIGETSPLGKLHVKTADSGVSSANANADDLIVENSDYTGISILGENESNIHFGDNEDPDVGRIEYSHSSNHMVFRTNGSDKMLINSSGNVGIGTTSPATNLHIDGVSNYNGVEIKGSGGSRPMLQFSNANNGDLCAIFGTEGNDMVLTSGSSNTERMRILSTGQVSFGTSSPLAGSRMFTLASASNPYGFTTQNDATTGTMFVAVFHSNGASAIGSITTSNTATAFNTSSDYRLKENIQPLENGLERLNNLKPVKFDWKEDGTSSEGFIAHEAQEVFSDAVTGKKDGEEMQGMDYGRITPLLVKAIQEQQEQIEQLQSEIQTLKGE